MFNRPPILDPIVTLEGGLLQTVKDFVNKNKLDIRKYERWSDGRPRMNIFSGPMFFSVRPNEAGTPGGYAINIHTKNGSINLPAGGGITISHDVGRITSIFSVMPLHTLNFDEAMALARQIDDNMTALGYETTRANRDMTEEKALENRRQWKKNVYAEWDKGDGGWIMMIIKPFSSYSRVAFTTPIGRAPNKQAPETYLLEFEMSVGSTVNREIRKLANARAMALTGEKEGEFPVKIWFDDPDWRPEGWQSEWLK